MFSLHLNIISNVTGTVENLIEERRPDAILSTGSWPEVVKVAEYGNRVKVPVISLATSQPLTVVPMPYLFSLSYPVTGYVRCLANLIKSYNWRRVIVIYEDDNYGSIAGSVIPLFSDALKAIGSEIESQVAFPSLDLLSNPKALLRQKLESVNRSLCRVFIVVRWSSPTVAIDLFREANALGMMMKGSIWITGDDITTLLDSTFTPYLISSYMQGLIGVSSYFNETTELFRDFRAKFQKRFELEYGKEDGTNISPGMLALRAYDAVHLIVRATAEAKKRNMTLLEGIRLTKMMGFSGRVWFRRDGNLAEDKGSSAFRIVNIVGRSYREMGFWLNGFGFYEEEVEMSQGGPAVDLLRPVYWPGRPERVPGGWGKLRVGIPALEDKDYFVKVEYNEEGKVKNVSGFCIDVFEMARKRLKYDLWYEFIPVNRTLNNSNHDELVAGVPKVYDAAVGDITIRSKRLANATFTEPFLPSDLAMLVRLKRKHTPRMLTKPFTKEVWLLTVGTFVYMKITLWYLERERNPEFEGPWWTQFGATLWLTVSTIFFAHGKIFSYYSKVVIMLWLFVVLILTTSYTACLSSILTAQKLEPVLGDNKVGYSGDPFVLKYLQEVMGYKQQKVEMVGPMDEALQNGYVSAVYVEAPYLRVFLSEHSDYTAYGEPHRLGGFGFVFPKDSPLASDFSEAILELSEDGELKKLEDKWLSCSLTSCPSTVKDADKGNLSLESFWFLFVFTIATSTIIMLLFKIRSLHGFGCSTFAEVGVFLRERFLRLWRAKLKRRNELQLPRTLPVSSPQVAPEPCVDLPPNNV